MRNIKKTLLKFEKLKKRDFSSKDVMQVVENGSGKTIDTAVTGMQFGYVCGYENGRKAGFYSGYQAGKKDFERK